MQGPSVIGVFRTNYCFVAIDEWRRHFPNNYHLPHGRITDPHSLFDTGLKIVLHRVNNFVRSIANVQQYTMI